MRGIPNQNKVFVFLISMGFIMDNKDGFISNLFYFVINLANSILFNNTVYYIILCIIIYTRSTI